MSACVAMSTEELARGLQDFSVYIYHVLRSRHRVQQMFQKDPCGIIMEQWSRLPTSSRGLIDRPEPFYRALCRYRTPPHTCSPEICPRASCTRWTQTDHVCTSVCRPYLPHAQTYMPHRCNTSCPRYVVNDYYICELSGNAHVCNEDLCDKFSTDNERRVCRWTGQVYALDITNDMSIDQNGENYVKPMRLRRAISAPPPTFAPVLSAKSELPPLLTPPPLIRSLTHAYSVMNRDPSLRPLVSITTTEQPEFRHVDQLLRLKNERQPDGTPPKKRQRRISKQARLNDSDSTGQHKRLYTSIFHNILKNAKGAKQLVLPDDFVEYVTEVIDRLWKFVIRSPVYLDVTSRYKQQHHCLHVLYTMMTGFNPESEDEYIVPLVPAIRDVLPPQKTMAKRAKIRMRLLTETAKDFRLLVRACPRPCIVDMVNALPPMPDSGIFFDRITE